MPEGDHAADAGGVVEESALFHGAALLTGFAPPAPYDEYPVRS